ncbi:hypothetical protein [Nonomuraea salmonea]|uniref:hypothetical protein n=1 Tax=Nonomuraea salmonea TaxID=46181 RepID=UPI003CD09251
MAAGVGEPGQGLGEQREQRAQRVVVAQVPDVGGVDDERRARAFEIDAGVERAEPGCLDQAAGRVRPALAGGDGFVGPAQQAGVRVEMGGNSSVTPSSQVEHPSYEP